MFAAMFYYVGLMAVFTKRGYMSSRFFFFFFLRFPIVAFIKNADIVLFVAICFNRSYDINKLLKKKKKKVYSHVFETRP